MFTSKETKPINTTIIAFNGLRAHIKQNKIPFTKAMPILWVSLNSSTYDDPENIKAFIDSYKKVFDGKIKLKIVLTGYMQRFNYSEKKFDEMLENEQKKAIMEGKKVENEWWEKNKRYFNGVNYCIVYWEDCVNPKKNIFFNQCVNSLKLKITKRKSLNISLNNTVSTYVKGHYKDSLGIHTHNSNLLQKEEGAWLPTLRLSSSCTHLIYLGSKTPFMKEIFGQNGFKLEKWITWMEPKFREKQYENIVDFQLDYMDNKTNGFSYAIDNPKAIAHFSKHKNHTEKKHTKFDFFKVNDYATFNDYKTLYEMTSGKSFFGARKIKSTKLLFESFVIFLQFMECVYSKNKDEQSNEKTDEKQENSSLKKYVF